MKVYKVQLAVVLLMAVLLNIGFYWQRAVLELDQRQNFQRLMHAHDGWQWLVWVAVAPLMLWLVRANPLTRELWLRSAAGLIAGSAALYLAVSLARLAVLATIFQPLPSPMTLHAVLHTQGALVPLDFLTLCGLFGISYSLDYYFKYRARSEEMRDLQLRTVQLQAELDRAQFELLRGHLQPHFLFNAFNGIATLVRQGNTAGAIDMIVRLGDLLRLAIERVTQPELPLAQEFEFAERYLDIERLRFSDKLQTHIALEPGAGDGLIPSRLLQPLVEHAVRLGISRRVRPGQVRLRAVRQNGRLQVDVGADGCDEGPGAAADWSSTEIAAARARLDMMYGPDYRCQITRSGAATDIRFDLPWKPSHPNAIAP